MPLFAAGFIGIEHFTPPWDVFFLPLFNLLILFYRLLFNDFALAIIVFTVVIRTVLAPLFIRQIRSQKEMQRMQPLIREVQRKHKGNRQKISEETMALYKEHGVNPAAGCLPVVLQLPILFALYQALIRASNLVTLTADQAKTDAFAALQQALPGITKIGETLASDGKVQSLQYAAPFQGSGDLCNLPQFSVPELSHFLPLNCQLIDPIKLAEPVHTTVPWLLNLDLAKPDHVFALTIPGVGFGLSLLAVIAAILQFVQVRMTSPRPNPDDPTAGATSTMTYLFPLLTIFWGGIFASGLILYWIVYTAYLVVQQFLVMGWGNLFPLFGWQPSWAPSPEGGIVARSRREGDATARAPKGAADEAERTRKATQPTTRASGSAAQQRAPRRPGQKRRGRKR